MLVDFVGTGNMGRPMAKNILRAGHRMTRRAVQPGRPVRERRLPWGGRPGSSTGRPARRAWGGSTARGSLGYRSPSREWLLTFLDQSVATLEIAVAD
jgi:hypothetical protein